MIVIFVLMFVLSGACSVCACCRCFILLCELLVAVVFFVCVCWAVPVSVIACGA